MNYWKRVVSNCFDVLDLIINHFCMEDLQTISVTSHMSDNPNSLAIPIWCLYILLKRTAIHSIFKIYIIVIILLASFSIIDSLQLFKIGPIAFLKVDNANMQYFRYFTITNCYSIMVPVAYANHYQSH